MVNVLYIAAYWNSLLTRSARERIEPRVGIAAIESREAIESSEGESSEGE
jgi:hypothetical protein